MEKISVSRARKDLSRLLREVARGEEVVITRNNHPIARLVQFNPNARQPGTLRGKIWFAPDFDEPLSEADLAAFEEYLEDDENACNPEENEGASELADR